MVKNVATIVKSYPMYWRSLFGITKDTTLVSIFGLFNVFGLFAGIRTDTAWNGVYLELFALIAFQFCLVCFSICRYSMYLGASFRLVITDRRSRYV